MRLARPSTLWRALSIELWRLLFLTAFITVTIVSFAAAIRPLADGRLGPAETLKFMMYAMVPMLQYALPFAAGFAATLAYHRLAIDNELVASHAGGISHRTLLIPAAVAGLILSGTLLALSDQAMPRLLRSMQDMITNDITKLMLTSVKRGESVRVSDRRYIYADNATELPLDKGSGAFQQFMLEGVLAVELDEAGVVEREASSRAAYVWLYRGAKHEGEGPTARGPGEQTTVVLRLREAVGQRSGMGLSELEDTTFVYPVPAAFSDDPKFHSWSDLNRAKQEPERMAWIERQRRELAGLIAEDAMVERLNKTLAAKGRATLKDSTQRTVTLHAPGLGGYEEQKGWIVRPLPGGLVEVTTSMGEGRTLVHKAKQAWVNAPTDEGGTSGNMVLRLQDVATFTNAAGGGEATTGGQLVKWTISDLTPEFATASDVMNLGTNALLARAAEASAKPGADARIATEAKELRKLASNLQQEILGKQNERIAGSVACLVMVLCGAVMAMRLRESMPLAVYLWSFLPSLACMITITSGEKATHAYGYPGLFVLWGGVAALAVYTALEYRALTRH